MTKSLPENPVTKSAAAKELEPQMMQIQRHSFH